MGAEERNTTLNSTHCHRFAAAFNRRDLLRRSAFGFGASALGSLMAREASAATNPLEPAPGTNTFGRKIV